MKLSNIFKKAAKKVAKTNVQKLEKNQLEKVIGGSVQWEPHKAPGLDSPSQD